MKRLISLVAIAALALPVAPATGAPSAEDGRIFVGGGTNLTNAYFFPGTGIYDGSKVQYFAPPQITQGSNFVLTNLDESTVTNIHQIRSRKNIPGTLKPLFGSAPVSRPGDSVTIITSRLKPGRYAYICTTHSGMSGMIEVVKG